MAFAASTLFLTSCVKDPEVIVPVVKDYAKVMLFHGATDASAVNLQINGVTKNSDSLKYGSATAYNQVELTAGKKTVVGAFSAKSSAKIATDSLLMNKDIGYSYFVYQENDAAKTVSMFKSVDDLALPVAGKGRVRLVHLIPDLQVAVDVELVAPGGLATTNSQFKNVKFKDLSNFLDVAAGSYEVKVKLTGTTQLLLSAPISITIADGKLYTVIARGYANAIAPRGGTLTVINNN
ncbi:MAG: DUF4397 domain-containing protein [Saprospiraceae bacterium]|nr:DUF4397 domain-containing protein [Saprospiraceae bacterium]